MQTNGTSREYADAVVDAGKKTGLPAINVYQLSERHQRDGVKDEELFTDGLHYTPRGYKVGRAVV
jgi:lysophospholipase L1-like esterase